jgi:ketosteroid isomerase-like protein
MILAALAGTLGCFAQGAAESAAVQSYSDDEAVVIATEYEWVRAEVARVEAALRRLIDDQFVFNSNTGCTSGKEALIENVLRANMSGQTIGERSILLYGDTAVVFGTVEIQFASPGEEETVSRLRYTSTDMKRGGQWRAIALHLARRTPDE